MNPDISHVLMTADTVGGVWTYALELAKELGTCGVNVTLATMGRPLSREQAEAAAALSTLDIRESSYQLEWMDNPWHDVKKAGEWLLGLERELKPDLVHLNNYAHGDLPWNAPVLMVAHSCVLSWWQAVKEERAPSGYNTYSQRVRAGLQAVDAVVAPSRDMLAAVEYHYGKPGFGTVIPNGIELKKFRKAIKEQFIFSMGRVWDEAKNIAQLETVARKLPWTVEIAGDQTHPVTGVQVHYEHARLLGKLDAAQVADKLSRASVFVMPARYEPFGLSVLEAAASGCALVLGAIPSLRENWQDAALFVNPDSYEALEGILLTLIENQWLLKELSFRAQERAQQFQSSLMGKTYFDLYTHLLAKSKREREEVVERIKL